jgi:hypothetical protein
VSFAGLNYKAGALDIGSSRVCVANKEKEGMALLLNHTANRQEILLPLCFVSEVAGSPRRQIGLKRGRITFVRVKEGPLTKNGPIDFAQSWAIHMKKSN